MNDTALAARRLTAASLCRMDAAAVRLLARQPVSARVLARLCAILAIGAAAYGFVFGLWRAPVQGLFSAVKLPLLMVCTVLASAVINAMLSHVMGARLPFRRVFAFLLAGMAVAAAVLGALAPAVALFVAQAPAPDPRCVGLPPGHPVAAASMRAYGGLLLAHVALIGAAGLAGNVKVYRLLRACVPGRALAMRLLLAWMAVSGFVGCELSWLLSPFQCKPTQPPHVIAREYFEENFYERLWRTARELERGRRDR